MSSQPHRSPSLSLKQTEVVAPEAPLGWTSFLDCTGSKTCTHQQSMKKKIYKLICQTDGKHSQFVNSTAD